MKRCRECGEDTDRMTPKGPLCRRCMIRRAPWRSASVSSRFADAWCWMIGLRPVAAFFMLMLVTGIIAGGVGR